MVVFQNINIIYEETNSLVHEGWLPARAVFIVFTRVTSSAKGLDLEPWVSERAENKLQSLGIPQLQENGLIHACQWGRLTQDHTSMVTPGTCRRTE